MPYRRRRSCEARFIAELGVMTIAFGIAVACNRQAAKDADVPVAEPTPQAQETTTQVLGVEARAERGDWPGNAEVTEYVTPVRLELTNRRAFALRLTYGDLELEASGQSYSALPPYEVDGEVQRMVDMTRYHTIHDPLLQLHDYYVFSPYASVYPTLPAFPSALAVDPAYYPLHYSYWEQFDLPTQEMLRRALPEGVLESGGRATGFVYFERLPAGVGEPTLHLRLVTSDGRQLAQSSVPVIHK